MSDDCSFGDTRRASEYMRGDIRMAAEDRFLTEDGDFWARTAENKQCLPQLF